ITRAIPIAISFQGLFQLLSISILLASDWGTCILPDPAASSRHRTTTANLRRLRHSSPARSEAPLDLARELLREAWLHQICDGAGSNRHILEFCLEVMASQDDYWYCSS